MHISLILQTKNWSTYQCCYVADKLYLFYQSYSTL